MVETVCNNMENSNLIPIDIPEYESQSNNKLTDDKDNTANGNMQLDNYSCTVLDYTNSASSKNLLDSSSKIMEVTKSPQNLIRDVDPNNIGSGNEEDDEISITTASGKSASVRRFRTIIDSDSEDDELAPLAVNKSKSFGTNIQVNQLTGKSKCESSRLRIDSDSDDDDVDGMIQKNNDDNQSGNDKIITETKSKCFSDLIDSESEDDNDNQNNYSSSEGSKKHPSAADELREKSTKKQPLKKRTGTKRAAKDEAMRHIHSETQRLIREAPVSLPYHRPKQRSLQEFLKRKKIAPAIPQASTAAAKLRMCTAIVSEVVKAKEIEAQLFYKSSDSEDDGIAIPDRPKNVQPIQSLPPITPAFVSIEETQKLHKIDIQNAQNKKQIIQQGMLELGMPRKLFTDDTNDPSEFQSIDTPAIVQQSDDVEKARLKECKLGLKEVSMPRKLFDNNFEDCSGESFKKYDSFTLDSTLQADNNALGSRLGGEIIQSLDKSSAVQAQNSEDNSHNIAVSQSIVILPPKLLGNSQDSSQLLQNEKTIDLIATHRTSTSYSSSSQSENCPIYDTPLISNKEFQKLNDKKLISEKSSNLSHEMCTSDTSQSSETDCGIEGLPLPIFDDYDEEIKPPYKKSMTVKKNTLINVNKLKPMLRGTPGTFIDFTQNVKPNKEAVNSLVDRFISKHSVAHKHIESKMEVTVIRTETTVEGLNIHKDVLPYSLPSATESIDDADLNKPGAKLLRLKEELEKKMASRRNEEWKQREQDLMEDDEEDEETALIELEPEGKVNASAIDGETSDAEESESEEDDILISDKKRKACPFGDEEAEVDEDGDMELSDDEMEEDDEEDAENVQDDGDECNESEEESIQRKQKKFSRIVTADDDSNSGGAIDDVKVSLKFRRKRTDVDMFGDEDEDELPISQQTLQASQLSPVFKTPLTPNNPPNSLESRANQVSSLGYNSARIDFDLKANELNSQSSYWQSRNNDCAMESKLFEIEDPNVTDEELMALCSGKFTESNTNTQNDNRQRLIGLIDSTSGENPVTESQIIDMCSGTFSSQGLFSSNDVGENFDGTSQDMRLTFDDSSQNSNDNTLERERREAKIDSEIQSSIQSFLDIASSSDDEIRNEINDRNKKKVFKKKKVKQLVLSDDEDGETYEEERRMNEEQEEDAFASDEEEEKFIDYDSEENEVVVVNKKDLRKVAANFVDAEAELTESEWGSEDEDEKDMDKLELEEGDGEEIDEDQMRAQLGKLHARQLLDDDQRDVRMLKEMLFEDGDLHTDGSGRERKFKWRNIDKLDDENLLGPTNDDDDGNQLDPTELAHELEWRKLRLEREKFLEEKLKSETNLDTLDDDIDIESGGKLLKLGMKVLKKCKTSIEIKSSTVQTSKPIGPRTVSELIGTSDGKTRMLHNAMKRGSFLARGDEALARLAVMIKKSDTVDLAPKHSKNFLFTHISPLVTGGDDEDDGSDLENKREEMIENKEKPARKRKTTTNGTPRTAKKPKIDMNRSSGKKLF